MSWMRLEDSFHGHRKVHRLADVLGIGLAQASGHLVLLWLRVLVGAPDGVLDQTWGPREIERAAGWEGVPGALFDALRSDEIRLLEPCDVGFQVHDWMRYAHSYKEAKRKEKWRMSRPCPVNATSKERRRDVRTRRDVRDEKASDHSSPLLVSQRERLETKSSSSDPSGDPVAGATSSTSSSPSEVVEREPRGASLVVVTTVEPPRELRLIAPEPPPARTTAAVNAVVEAYRLHHPRARPGEKERRKIAARLAEGYSAEDLIAAVDGCHRSPWHCGENPEGKTYQSLDLIVRDSSHVASFIEASRVSSSTGGRVDDRRRPRPMTAAEHQVAEAAARLAQARNESGEG